ncbi:MAG: aminopeptidase [Capsulimonadales bacterium]|nr:aminopeptidase [Capsulimonadales bacterium]
MPDPRNAKLADVLIRHSLRLEPGEKVLVEAVDVPDEIVTAIVDRIYAAEAIPFVELRSATVLRALYRQASDPQTEIRARHELARMKDMDAYIAVRGSHNALELVDVPAEKMRIVQGGMREVQDYRVGKTNWVVLRYPSPAFAQSANMSTEQFTDFFFDVCTLDYGKMEIAQQPLKERMEKADRVRIVGPGTDLTFSIRGIGAQICSGLRNIPDGECFTCPTIDSANGEIFLNAPTSYQGKPFDSIRLVLKDGVITEATASDTPGLNKILDSDEGARRIGEFSLGFNPYILQPMRDTLFDEKIAGSFHFTPGKAYDRPGNGNHSQIHWDMVCIQRPEFGGGEVWFDDELIRKDGLFVPEDLLGLNPENLI